MHLSFEDYYWAMYDLGDIDPSYSMLRYLADRFDLTGEQRYWLAFLYGVTYCGPSAYYVYNEFPDLENIDAIRLERWWANRGRTATYFQTDRRWIRSRNQFVDAVLGYRDILCGRTQHDWFLQYESLCPFQTYDNIFQAGLDVPQMGRFGLFNWLEAVHVVTEYPCLPRSLRLRDAESCRNGLAYALNRLDLLTDKHRTTLTISQYEWLQAEFDYLIPDLQSRAASRRVDVWTVETVLCAYKKYRNGQRYPGYYLDRQAKEIAAMSQAVPYGVHWGVLWEYRQETFQKHALCEAS